MQLCFYSFVTDGLRGTIADADDVNSVVGGAGGGVVGVGGANTNVFPITAASNATVVVVTVAPQSRMW
jgi:hypothetical protein